MLPSGGFQVLGVAFGGSVEYQQNWNPHFHGNVHTACVYQQKTMTEIAEMMESNLLKLETLAKYQSWMHREEHLDHDSHQSNIKLFEERKTAIGIQTTMAYASCVLL